MAWGTQRCARIAGGCDQQCGTGGQSCYKRKCLGKMLLSDKNFENGSEGVCVLLLDVRLHHDYCAAAAVNVMYLVKMHLG